VGFQRNGPFTILDVIVSRGENCGNLRCRGGPLCPPALREFAQARVDTGVYPYNCPLVRNRFYDPANFYEPA